MNIVPQEIVSTEVVSSFDIRVSRLELFIEVYLLVTIISSNGKPIGSPQLVILKGDDYKAWSNDDLYLYTYVFKFLYM